MHVNAAACVGCDRRLEGTDPRLAAWVREFRVVHPDAHISCGSRGEADQNEAFARGASKARWLESPHNYGLAVDLFRLTLTNGASFDPEWFRAVVGPAARAAGMVWGGDFKSLADLPHVEMAGWKGLAGL